MGIRRKSREMAMQALFYMDSRHTFSQAMFQNFCKIHPPPKKSRPFLRELIFGILEKKDEIDRIINEFSSNWKLDRMSGVDRNLLRIATYEMLFVPEIPTKVSINEAIEIGKKYGTEESGSFINGILDSIRLAKVPDKDLG